MSGRVDPFGSLDDFKPAPPKPKSEILDVVDQVAAQQGFPSRQPAKQASPEQIPGPAAPKPAEVVEKESLPSRRRTTGRSEQVNIKTTFAAKKRLLEISVERNWPLGEVLERALQALEDSWDNGTEPT